MSNLIAYRLSEYGAMKIAKHAKLHPRHELYLKVTGDILEQTKQTIENGLYRIQHIFGIHPHPPKKV